jgi:hypothetical protein
MFCEVPSQSVIPFVPFMQKPRPASSATGEEKVMDAVNEKVGAFVEKLWVADQV